jgi:hypothetical protein
VNGAGAPRFSGRNGEIWIAAVIVVLDQVTK